MNPEFVIFVGPMFGGKTTKLLSAIDRYKYQGRRILAFKPDIDQRYSREEIVTHWGHKLNATRISKGEGIQACLNEVPRHSREILAHTVIAVDEAFMIPNVGDTLVNLFKKGHTVLVSSLQLSSDFSAYPEIQKMMPYATKIEVCPAVCSLCSADAYYTKKTGGRKDHKIEVGGSEMYQPRCFEHFKKV